METSTALVTQDSSLVTKDSIILPLDSTNKAQSKGGAGIQSQVNIIAGDSLYSDFENNIVHLYKGAKVKYQEFEISADYIRLDQNKNEVFASGVYDHSDKYVGRPVVLFPNDTPKSVDSLTYNFKTAEGNTFGIMTEVDGGFIQAKIIRKNMYDEMSLYHGLYSTCNLPEPHTHFGFFISKGLVTKNQIIAGPSYLVLENIPLKFAAIPFGFFPKPNKRNSGFLFPSFGEDYTRGFAMRDIGWYFAFNDYWDSEVRGTVYSKGSYELGLNTRYQVNYKYNGSMNFRYAAMKTGIEGTDNYGTNKVFNLTWSHSQRQEANPGTSFSASVNFGTGSFYQNVGGANGSISYDQMVTNDMSSSIAYGKVFADGKVNFTSAFSHSQNISTGAVNIQLPNINLNVSTFNPFDSKDRIGDQKWYQRITVGYSVQARNSISTTESELFKKESIKKFSNGFQHNIPVALSLNAFKYFQFNTSVNYTERWYFQSIRKYLDNLPNGFEEKTDTIQGFNRAYDYSISSGLSTKIYGMYPKIGKVEAIRHVITPSINLNYRPDFSADRYGFFRSYENANGSLTDYSIFQNGIYGSPSGGRSMGIGFSVDNNIEAKVRSKSDTTDAEFKKISILQGLTFSGNYNFVADSMKLSNINFSGRTSIFKEKVNINFNGTLDPYQIDRQGQRYNRYALQDGKLARLTNFGFSFDYSLNPNSNKSRNQSIDSLRNTAGNSLSPEQSATLARIAADPNAFVDFNIPWNLAGSFMFNYSVNGLQTNYSATLNLHGDFNITPKWKVQFNSGFDFVQKEIPMTRFSIYRDLHCWDMSVGWIPFGRYQSYNVTIRAKASLLQDLKLSKRNSSGSSF